MMKFPTPRLSNKAIAYLEDFDRRSDDTPLRLKVDQSLRSGDDDDTVNYEGPHLGVYGRDGLYGSSSVGDPVTIRVGSRDFVMSPDDLAALGDRNVELIPVYSSGRSHFQYVLAIV